MINFFLKLKLIQIFVYIKSELDKVLTVAESRAHTKLPNELIISEVNEAPLDLT